MSPRFPSTRWSQVLAAGARDERSNAALSELCNAYWAPLRAFARARGATDSDADDLVQGFLSSLLEGKGLSSADPDKGRFRSYLLRSFRNHNSNQRRHARAKKRGGGAQHLELDEGLALQEEGAGTDPERAYHHAWVSKIIATAHERVRADYLSRGRVEEFDGLRDALSGDIDDYGVLASTIGKSRGATRVSVHRLRTRVALCIREQVADTVDDETSVDDELRFLLGVASGRKGQ